MNGIRFQSLQLLGTLHFLQQRVKGAVGESTDTKQEVYGREHALEIQRSLIRDERRLATSSFPNASKIPY